MQRNRTKQVYEEASEWVAEMHGGEMDTAVREQLNAWFRRSPEHIRAFLLLSCACEELEDSKLDLGYSLDELIARGRASTNVIALEGESRDLSRPGSGSVARRMAHTPRVGILTLTRFFSWRSAVLASVALVCSSAGLVALNGYRHTHFAAGTGEQRIVHLTDGSTIELNSNSRVRILFSERERDVELVEGQALFKVAKDRARPFVVQSALTSVRAVGTQFDVYRKAFGTRVTVVEGRVAVRGSTGESALSPVLVSIGEQVTVTDQEVPKPRRADVGAATAWTQGKLVFDMAPLSEVVQEFNRYNTRKLVVSDPTLAELAVTGIFSSADPASLLRFLRAQQGIEVTEAGGEIRISKK